MRLSQLAKRMLVHPSTVTLRIEELEKRGFAKRERHPSDGRAVLVSLTIDGERVVEDAHRDLADMRFGLEGVDADSALEVIAGLLPVMGERE